MDPGEPGLRSVCELRDAILKPSRRDVLIRRLLTIPVLALLITVAAAAAQEGRPFTPDDALDVRLVDLSDVTADGRWAAATLRTRRNRLGVDHERFGDPTYVSPTTVEVVVVDTREGDVRHLFDEPVRVRALEWAPDAPRLAFFMYRRDGFGLYLYDAEADETREVVLGTGLEIASDAPLEWAPDGRSVLVSLRPEGWAEEARSAFLELTEGPVVVQDSRNDFLAWDRVHDLDLRQIPALVALADGSVRELVGETAMQGVNFSEDGSFLTYVEARPTETAYLRNEGTDYELFRLDLDGGEPVSVMGPVQRRISGEWNHVGDALAWSDDGHVLLRDLDADSAVTLTEGLRGPVSEDDTTSVSFSVVAWRPDDDALLARSQQGYHLLDADGSDVELVFPFAEDEEVRPRLELEGWSDDGRHIFLSASAPDRWERGILRFDLETGEVADLARDASLYRDWFVSEDGRRFVFRMSDGDRPDEIYAADADFSEVRRLTDLNPQLDGVALTRSELVEYLDVDGNRLYGILYYPYGYEEGKAYPLVAEIYEDFFDNGYHESMNLVTARGWFGFRPSVEFEEGYPGEAWLKGVTTGINEVIDRGLVDEDKLGVHGTSYGGYATNLLITQTDRFAAAVNISGKVNIISFLGDSPKITTRNYRAAEIGQDRIGATLWEQPRKYVAHSAVMFADRIDTPLLMLSGEGDWNVPATNQREMYYALRRLGKEVVWVHYMMAGHGAGRAGTVDDYHDHWRRMFEWYGEHFAEENGEAATEGGGGGR